MKLKVGQHFKEVRPIGGREIVIANIGEHWVLGVLLHGETNRFAQHPALLSVRVKHLADPARWVRAKRRGRSLSKSQVLSG
jgi:hypothetical protein